MKKNLKRLIGVAALLTVGVLAVGALVQPTAKASNGYPRFIACASVTNCPAINWCARCPNSMSFGGGHEVCSLVGCGTDSCDYNCVYN